MYFPATISFSQITHSTEVMASASAPIPPSTFSRNLAMRDQGSDVHALQAFLNANGFRVSQKGPGSLGNETNFFGRDTYAALVKFQKANNIPATGYFGPQTRSAIYSGGGVALH
jgi:peptidoglycan hydrolase-like protein with peptidoglycan-binding domain